MGKILNPKILIPVLVGTALLGLVAYILFAPATWWKPFYVRVDMGGETTAEAQGVQEESTPTTVHAAVPQMAEGPKVPGFGEPSVGIMYQLDTKVVNLAEPGGLRYLQASIVLEFWPLIENYNELVGEEKVVAVDEFKAEIDVWKPVIDDLVTGILSSKTYNDVATIEGKEALKEELITAINGALGYEGVVNVYFTSFLVQ
jgi:flagellar FliL protein